MNIPRFCEAHRGIRALQSAHMSRKLELSGIQWHVKYIWETHCCRVETQVRAKPSGSSLSGACFVATSSSRIEESVRLRCKANVRFWLGFDNAYWLLAAAWTAAAGLRLRFCLANALQPNKVTAHLPKKVIISNHGSNQHHVIIMLNSTRFITFL